MAYVGSQPIYILSEGSRRTSGRDAQSMNIVAGRAVAEAVRTTLGPKGMDKMLVDTMGNVVITNDGVTILDEMDVDHPAAQMIVEVAQTQEDETGDGTTTAVILAGELLARAEDLLENDVHPTVVANGYRFAAAEARDVLESLATEVEGEDALREIAITAMTGKGAESSRDLLADLVVEAVSTVESEDGIDLDDVVVEPIVGGSVADSHLVRGVVMDKERAHENMPKRVTDAKVLLFDAPIEVRETDIDASLDITSPAQLEGFLAREEAEIREMVDTIVDSGATVVVCQKAIDDLAVHYLSKAGVLAVKRAKKSDVRALARATGATITSEFEDLESALGDAGLVEQREMGDETRIFVEDCPDAKAVTLVLRGGTEHVVSEVERAVEDALGVVRVTALDGRVLAGGGAPEIELARQLRDFADSVSGREQLAVEAFAGALEIVPRTLAENAGLDPIDSLVDLRARHEAGDANVGLDVYTGATADMMAQHVVEPVRVKLQAIESATEAVELLLRIDDVVAAGDLKKGGEFDEMDF
ncbi:thermosome subunit alpha [Halomarina rubra]|uniref:Thermosome subunit alpha n=1 Tax=Halomarina rubra TaxID=2071873 RepID=A0ABD6ATW5_9EURY|nr:thermosome subunit alpha [Halomarina rubra]